MGIRANRRECLAVLVLFATMAGAADCGGQPEQRVASPAEIQLLGTKAYPGHSRDDVFQASAAALKKLGFTLSSEGPVLRTEPKTTYRHTQIDSTQTTVTVAAFDEQLAFEVDVQGDTQSATVHAKPQVFVGGQPQDAMTYDGVQGSCRVLFAEIDRALAGSH